MTLTENLGKEILQSSTRGAVLTLKIQQRSYGEEEGLKLFIAQVALNIETRAQVNGQEAVQKQD